MADGKNKGREFEIGFLEKVMSKNDPRLSGFYKNNDGNTGEATDTNETTGGVIPIPDEATTGRDSVQVHEVGVHTTTLPKQNAITEVSSQNAYKEKYLSRKGNLGSNRIIIDDSLFRFLTIINVVVGNKTLSISHYINNILEEHVRDDEFLKEFINGYPTFEFRDKDK